MCHEQRTAPFRGGDGISAETIAFDNDGLEVPALLARPATDEAPAVLVVHDVNGANDFYRDVTERLAGAGFLALLPDFFVREGALVEPTREAVKERAAQLDKTTSLGDIAAAIEWLRALPGSNGRVGLVGFCMGGTFAMLSVTQDPAPDAAVSFYGFPAAGADWPARPLDAIGSVKSPLLLLVGDQDAGVGMDNMKRYVDGLEQAGKVVESVIYPGLPHGFLTFDSEAQHYRDAQDAWQRAVDFLKSKLRSL